MNSELRQIRAVHRALDLLEHLGERGPCSLQQLHVATGLSKSTLRRLLGTLMQRHFIRRGISDGMYRTNVPTLTAVNSDLTLRIGRLVEVARPHMLALTNQVQWPSDLHIYVQGRMRILESTHGMSPFGNPESSQSDVELNLFGAASGLAFLASSDDRIALKLVDELKDKELWSLSRFGVTPARLLRELRDIREKGYAVRRITQGRAQGRNAIAVAVLEGKVPIGALTISWQRQFMPADSFATLHLEPLRTAAKAISRGLTETDQRRLVQPA